MIKYILKKPLKNILIKLDYIPKKYLHQSRAKTREAKETLKNVRAELSVNNAERASLKKEVKKLKTINLLTLNTSKLQNWAKKVKKHKICDICDKIGVPMTAHHLWAKSKHPTLAYERVNGVCLCLLCHNGYHEKYTHIEDCNPYTYNEYKTDYQNKIRLEVLEVKVEDMKLTNKIKKIWHKINKEKE